MCSSDLIRAAAETADLVVVGTHNSRGPFRWWLGSVAEHVALESPAPVLVIGSHAPPAADVLERVAVIRRGGPADDVGWQCAGVLAKVVAGRIVDAGTMASCGTDALAGASCAVLTLDRQTKSSDAAADVADLLSRCPHPLLIVPV